MHAMLDNVSAERDAALGGAAAAAANGEDMPAKVEAMQAEVSPICQIRFSFQGKKLLSLFFFFWRV